MSHRLFLEQRERLIPKLNSMMVYNTGSLSRIGKKLIPKRWHYKTRLFYHKLDNLIKHRTFDFFTAIEVEVTTACNRRCSYCPNSKFDRGLIKNQKLIKTEIFHKLVDELVELNFIGRFSPLGFGEPLLDKRLPDLITYVRNKLALANIVIYTNGELLTLDLYKKLTTVGINSFFITQHSPSMPVTIKKLFDYRKLHKDGVGINYIIFSEEIRNGTHLLIYNRGGLVATQTTKMKKCDRPARNVSIDHKGNIILCCNDYHSSIKFGNLKNEKLLDIWNKPFYKKIRKNLKKGIFDLEICQKCTKI